MAKLGKRVDEQEGLLGLGKRADGLAIYLSAVKRPLMGAAR